ncbi:MAG TPA: amidase [Rectinemataceae bacterium]|nr:amidase [Rectinemataceae bacterium]
MSGEEPIDYDELGIRDFQRFFDSGALSSQALVLHYRDRIARFDKAGPSLNSVLHLNDEALGIAEALDIERKMNGARGMLHGIPVMIKANMNIAAPSLPTTAGSLALRGFVAPADAAVVARLKRAGAVILGSTNMSEWANFRSVRSTSGWSSEGRLTRNPYALDRNPSGSSSGSAVAVSANLCAVAVGTETDGSIIAPSSKNGIVGIKPSVGLVSREGIIPISASQDTAGPMARTVEDAALLLAAMVEEGGDELSAFLDSLPGEGILAGLRIGIARNFAGFDPGVDRVFDDAVETLRGLGAELVESDFKMGKELADAAFEVMLYEFKAGVEGYLATYAGASGIHGLADIIAFNRDHADIVMPWFDQDIFLLAAAKGSLDEEVYRNALQTCRRLAREEGIDASMDGLGLDALIAPSGGPAGKTDFFLGDHYLGGSASPAAIAGYPNLTLPAGFVHGLPVGLSIFGRAFSEKKLLRVALAFEKATHFRRNPTYAPTLDSWL